VKAAAPNLRSSQSIISDEYNWTTSVTGTSPEYFQIRNWPIDSGAGFTQSDVTAGAKSVVLGKTVVEKLFGMRVDPVGQSVRIGNTPFTVVGVAAAKGQSSSGQDYDDAAFIPYTTFARRIQGGLSKYLSGMVYVQAISTEQTIRAMQDVTQLLRDRHKLGEGQEDDFSIRNMNEIAGAQQQGTDTMTSLLASVAAVSLLVGGIGIMNIMLVSVTERTREIGVRMAIGAKPRSILAQFLIEALVLSVVGGILGVALGVGIALWLTSKFQWPIQIQVNVIALSVGFSGLVGIVFGLFPARKAAQLDPIDALHYE
jgi:putative ABC transport system permease protein